MRTVNPPLPKRQDARDLRENSGDNRDIMEPSFGDASHRRCAEKQTPAKCPWDGIPDRAWPNCPSQLTLVLVNRGGEP